MGEWDNDFDVCSDRYKSDGVYVCSAEVAPDHAQGAVGARVAGSGEDGYRKLRKI